MGTSDSFQNKTPSETYKDLIHFSNSNGGVTTGIRTMVDGKGSQIPIAISSTGLNVVSGFLIAGTEVTASADQLNTLSRSFDDGVVQVSKALVADAGGNIATSGGSFNLSSSAVNIPYGTIQNFELGQHSHSLTVHSGTASSTGIVIFPASGQLHHIYINNSKTQVSIRDSAQMNRDDTSASQTAYYLKLFFQQGSSGGHNWAWDSSTSIKWEPTFPSGYGTSSYGSGIPFIRDTGTVYSGGIRGGHVPSINEMDIVEMYSLDKGSNWYARRVASGIL